VVDAKSKQFETPSGPADLSLSLISFPTPTLVEDLKATYAHDTETQLILQTFQQNKPSPKGFSMQRGLLLKKGRLWILKHSPFQLQFWSSFILTRRTAGHSSYHKTLQQAKTDFFWKGMCQDIKKNF